jgi:N-acetylmuramic acid 6-phosphate (MurNAc-6-P) etherase
MPADVRHTASARRRSWPAAAAPSSVPAGAEDDERRPVARCARVRRGDVVVGIPASGVTPFAGLAAARKRGAKTVLISCNATRQGGIADVRRSCDGLR